MADRPRILVINPNSTEAVTAGIHEEVAEVPRPGAVRIDCLTLAEGVHTENFIRKDSARLGEP